MELTRNPRNAIVIGLCLFLMIFGMQMVVMLVNLLGRHHIMSGTRALAMLAIVGGMALALVRFWSKEAAREQLEDDGEARPLLSRDDDERLPVGWSTDLLFDADEFRGRLDELEQRMRPNDCAV